MIAVGPTTPLHDLRAHFLATSTRSMPLAGLFFWAFVGVMAFYLSPQQLGLLALAGPGAIFPLAMLLERLRGRPALSADSRKNPVVQMFMQSIFLVALLVPFVIIVARMTGEADVIVLGMAILAGIVWIPYGWGADDRAGLYHCIGRTLGCYIAFLLAPDAWRASAICAVVCLAYIYALIAMKRPDAIQEPGA